MKGCWIVSLIIGTLLFSAAAFADTCAEVVKPTPRLRSAFKLTVLDSTNTPKADVRVALGTMDRYNAMHPVSAGVTDANGVLNFAKVKPGNLTFQFTDSSGERQWYDVEIVSDGGDASVDYSWPYVNWIPLRSAGAILMNGSSPMIHWHVTLQGYPDGNELAFGDTDAQGKFDLPASKPGRYYVELSQSESNTGTTKSLGRIPVSVTMDERYPAVDVIFVADTACGLNYDQFCVLPPAKLENACMQAVDSSGAGLPNAYAKIYSQHGFIGTSDVTADKDGKLNLSNLTAGDYQLQIFSKGHTPVRRSITIAPGAATCSTPTVIPMNSFGSGCTPASPGKGN
jgi:hypothetical protein